MRVTASVLLAGVVCGFLAAGSLALAQMDDDDDDENPVLGRVVKEAPISLEQGFAASAREGTPISGKFELDVDGAQLSVYTVKGEAFSEVIVDHKTGRIAKVIPITEGNDLRDALNQLAVMKEAQRALEEMTASALRSHQGFRTVSATPGRKDGAAVVKLVLTNGTQWTTVHESLRKEVDW